MRRRKRGADAFVEEILRDRRPPRFPAEDEEARAMLAAATLRAGRPGADAPSPAFVEGLERRLRRRVQEETAQGETSLITRRRLLGGAAVAAAAAAVGAGVDRVVDRSVEGGTQRDAELVPHSGRWVDVASLEEVPVGRPLRFSAGAIEGFVVNHGDRVAAVSAMCTHMPCTLRLDTEAQRLDCPCHGAWFGLDGSPVGSGYPYTLPPLPTVRTRVVAGRVEVLTA
jgi:cytochrome b6-f complex iron-sulfur subunit